MLKIRNSVFLILLQLPFLVFAFTTTSTVIGNLPLNQNPNLSSYFPQNVKSVPEVLISRDQYVISYNQDTRLLNWAAWKLELSDIGHAGRSNNFLPDPDLQNYLNQFNKQAVTPLDYRGTCFDRGHQVPSGDRDTTKDINNFTFLMSNMIPQTAFLNRFIWEHLESYTRDLVINQNKKVYIIAGPIFNEDFGKIGPNNDIPVPSKNFKIIIVLDKDQTLSDVNLQTRIISVVMPNLLKTGKKPLDDKDELCLESNPPPKPPVVPPVSPTTPEPLPTPEPVPAPVALDPAPVTPLPTAHPLNDDWMKYEVSLKEVEKLSGFKLTPEPEPQPTPAPQPQN